MTLQWLDGRYVWTMDLAELATIHAALRDAYNYAQYQKDEYSSDSPDSDQDMKNYDEIYDFLTTERPKTLRKQDK